MTSTATRRFFRLSCIATLLALPAACQTASLNEVAPASASGSAPRNTGTFPNLNIATTPAAAQITPAERQAKTAELRAAQAAQQTQAGAGSGQTSEAALRTIGQGQAKTLSDIENE